MARKKIRREIGGATEAASGNNSGDLIRPTRILSYSMQSGCLVLAMTDRQNIPSGKTRLRPNTTRLSGTTTYSVSHWLIMQSVYPAIAVSTARVPSLCAKMSSEPVGAIALIR